ncbi:MAG: aldehyde dehydrogenase [Thermoflexales bacterium]|nr:aldehyde dehydrogenase [Thermoflexales bacterium]MDW8351903.1 aldehyde dehydrogenase [Anaerolineae bacterium]
MADSSQAIVAGIAVKTDHFINNQRVGSARRFIDISPIDQTVLAHVAAGGEAEVDQAVAAAKAAFAGWAALGPHGRGPILRRLADAIERRNDDLALVETHDNGSLLEAMRLRVMRRAAYNIRFFADYAENLRPAEWDTQPANAHNRVCYDPAGVTAVITPWNAPLMLATWRIGPALAAGNTVVLKPPEWAPLTASLLADCALEAGVPPGVINVVQGIGEEAGAALVAHPDVERIAFTGSPETARLIGAAAAKNLTPVSFELGGKSPFIVFDDADFELALKTALGQYDNAGQVCLAGTRLLVQHGIYDRFLEGMIERAPHIKYGDPRVAGNEFGPLIHPDHLARVQRFVDGAVRDGARLVYGGKVNPQLGGLYFEPTLFIDVPPRAEILRKEVFGPVLTLQAFHDEDEAIAMANDTEYGLAAVIFTRDEARANRVANAVVAGTAWVNCFFVRDLAAPFGGARHSGIGREGGLWSFDFYCDVKNVCYRIGTFA